MEARPRIKIQLTTIDKIIEVFGWIALVSVWILAIYFYKTLPDIIPIHFNASGEADNYGNKATLFVLPVLGTITFTGLTFVNRLPHIFNYPANITTDNALPHYTNATRAIRWIKTIIQLIFILIILFTNLAVKEKSLGLGMWLLPIILIPVLVPTIYFVVRSYKIGK